MRFPSISQLPLLTAEETADWYYPAYERRPYTSRFANQVIDLITTEEHFWRHLKYLRISGINGNIVIDLQSHGSLSLPRWELEVGGRQFVSVNDNSTVRVALGTQAELQVEDGTQPVVFRGDWSSRLSEFGQLVHHLLPYMSGLQLITEHDHLSFSIPK